MNVGATLGRQELAENFYRIMDGKKFVEIKKPVEEVREIENKEQEQKKLNENQGSKLIEKLKTTILPIAHASDGDDEKKEGLKEGAGGVVIGSGAAVGTATTNPAIGVAAGATTAGVAKGLGKIEKGIGKLAGDKSVETMGEALDEGSTTGIKDLAKKIFD